MIKYDFMKYTSHAVMSFSSLLAYDVFIMGYNLNSGYPVKDATAFAISSVVSNFSSELLSSLVPYLNENNLTGMLSYPLLSGLVYSYIYDMNVNNSYPGIRDKNSAFIIGSVGCLLVRYIENPIMSLFGFKSYY